MVDFSEKGRSQFLKELQDAIVDIEEDVTLETVKVQNGVSDLQTDEPQIFDLAIEEKKEGKSAKNIDLANEPENMEENTTKELEQVMNQGMGFLSGLFKMATGKNIGMNEQSISINKETGEVTMKLNCRCRTD